MALAKDPSALAAFGRLPAQERAGYVSRAHRAASRGEMQSIIVELGTHSTF